MKLRRSAIAAAAATVLTLTACGTSDDLDDDSDDSSSQTDSGSDDDTESDEDAESDTESDTESDEDADDDTDIDSDEDPESDEDADVGTAALTEDTLPQVLTDAQTDAGSVTMDMTLTSGGQVVTAQGEVLTGESVEDSGADMTMQIPGAGDLQMVLVDGDFYMNLGQLSQNKFVVIDLDDADNPLAQSFEGFEEQFDVAATTEALEDAIVDFEAVGPETVEGVETDRYDVTVNTEDMLETLGAAGGGPLAGQLPKTMSYSFWTDDDNLPVKVTAEAGGPFDIVFLFSGWGDPVDIVPPSPNQISKKDPFSTPS